MHRSQPGHGRSAALLCMLLPGFIGLSARADGLQDFKQAIARLNGQTPVKALLDVKTWQRNGEGSDAQEHQGQASATLEDTPRGMQLSLTKDILARAEAEKRAEAKDPKAATPTLNALKEFDTVDVYPLLSATGRLSRVLDEAVFKEEKADTYNGKPARLLRFNYLLERLPEHDRKYVKKYDSTLDLWIGTDGVPLASRLTEKVSGRAFVVVSFESQSEAEYTYSLVGDRLVTVRATLHDKSSGAGEQSERRIVRTLQLQS